MKKNIAVIGCGHWGKNLVRNFSEINVLGCICDEDVKNAEKLSSTFNVPVRNFDEIIKDSNIQGIVLSVPASLHSSMSIKAMENRKHVYVEKPLALNIKDAKEMILKSNQKGVHLMVGHLLQYHPIFEQLKRIVHEKKIGDILYIHSTRQSFGKIRNEENVVWSFAPHDISMILSLIKDEPIDIKYYSSSILQKGIADIADIHLKFKDNLNVRISVSWLNPEKQQKLVIIGKKGMIIFDDTLLWSQRLKLYNYELINHVSHPVLNKKEQKLTPVSESEPLKNECKYFLDLIDKKVEPLTDGYEGLRVLNILDKISQLENIN